MREPDDPFSFLDGLSRSELIAVGVKYEIDVPFSMVEDVRPDMRERVEARWRENRERQARGEVVLMAVGESGSASEADAQTPPETPSDAN